MTSTYLKLNYLPESFILLIKIMEGFIMIKKSNATKPGTGDNVSYAKSKNSSTTDAGGISEINHELILPVVRMV